MEINFRYVPTNHWWLVIVTLVVAFGFLPKNFRRWWGPVNALIPQGDRDTEILLYAKEFV